MAFSPMGILTNNLNIEPEGTNRKYNLKFNGISQLKGRLFVPSPISGRWIWHDRWLAENGTQAKEPLINLRKIFKNVLPVGKPYIGLQERVAHLCYIIIVSQSVDWIWTIVGWQL